MTILSRVFICYSIHPQVQLQRPIFDEVATRIWDCSLKSYELGSFAFIRSLFDSTHVSNPMLGPICLDAKLLGMGHGHGAPMI